MAHVQEIDQARVQEIILLSFAFIAASEIAGLRSES